MELLKTTIEEVDVLKKELDGFRPIDEKTLAKIMQKLRLDWNYHSNRIEGNKLTYGETKQLLLHGLTAKGKPLKDHLDIQGHNDALYFLESILKESDNRPITQHFIRNLHKLILREPYDVVVENKGHRVSKTIKVGQYKTTSNHVMTRTGEMFYFAEPHEVQPKMDELIRWYKSAKNDEIHPLIIASEFHYRFIRIHPFDDGNGRLARILMNLILMSYGYAPVVIKFNEKDKYYNVLEQADGGDLTAFIVYIGGELKKNLSLMIRGAKGESIEEPEDLDKRIALLQSKLNGLGTETVRIKRSKDAVSNVIDKSIIPLFEAILRDSLKISPLFYHSEARISGNSIWPEVNLLEKIENKSFLRDYIKNNFLNENFGYFEIYLRCAYDALRNTGTGASIFSSSLNITISWQDYKYRIVWQGEKKRELAKLYHQDLTKDEISMIVSEADNKIISDIEEWLALQTQ